MNYYTELSLVACAELTPTDFEAAFDQIADALYDCEGVEDAHLASDYDASSVTFTMNVPNVSGPEEAMAKAMTFARTALRVSGGSTPKWEGQFAFMRQTIEAHSGRASNPSQARSSNNSAIANTSLGNLKA